MLISTQLVKVFQPLPDVGRLLNIERRSNPFVKAELKDHEYNGCTIGLTQTGVVSHMITPEGSRPGFGTNTRNICLSPDKIREAFTTMGNGKDGRYCINVHILTRDYTTLFHRQYSIQFGEEAQEVYERIMDSIRTDMSENDAAEAIHQICEKSGIPEYLTKSARIDAPSCRGTTPTPN